jgi:DNA-binding CsgD family transcriptional regulator
MIKVLKKLKRRLPSKEASNETDFLLSTEANAKRLSESIKQDKLGRTIILKGERMIMPRKIGRANFKLLTDHQIRIVFMICKEKSAGEIARKLNISEKTFFNTRLSIFKKLAVKSTIGLVKYVYKYKYLKL